MSTIEAISVEEATLLLLKAFKECNAMHKKWPQLAVAKNGKGYYHSLKLGMERIHEEYEMHYQRLGDKFGAGDGIYNLRSLS